MLQILLFVRGLIPQIRRTPISNNILGNSSSLIPVKVVSSALSLSITEKVQLVTFLGVWLDPKSHILQVALH